MNYSFYGINCAVKYARDGPPNSPIISPTYKRTADESAARYSAGVEHTDNVKNIRNRFEDDDEELNFAR